MPDWFTPQRRAADEAERAAVHRGGVEVVDRDAAAAGADEGVRVHVLVEEGLDRRHVLIGKIAPHRALARDRVVGRADAREQQQAHVVELECADDDEVGRLLGFISGRVDVGHAGRALLVGGEVDAQHVRIGPQLEQRRLLQRRQDVDVGRRLRIQVAPVAAAESAEVARAHAHVVGVGVRLRCVRGGQRVRVQPELAGGLAEELGGVDVLQRRQRKFIGAARLERVAAAHHFAAYHVRLARGAEHLLCEVEIRFELFVAHAVILDRHAVGDELPAVALFVVAAQAQVFGRHAEVHAGPVRTRAAHAVAGQEGAVLAIGQRPVADAVSDRHRLAREVLEKLAADAVGQLVDDLRIGEIGIGVAVRPTLQCHNPQARFGQLLREDRAGPAEADDHRVDGFLAPRLAHLRPACRRFRRGRTDTACRTDRPNP